MREKFWVIHPLRRARELQLKPGRRKRDDLVGGFIVVEVVVIILEEKHGGGSEIGPVDRSDLRSGSKLKDAFVLVSEYEGRSIETIKKRVAAPFWRYSWTVQIPI